MHFFKKVNSESIRLIAFYTLGSLFAVMAIKVRWVPMIKHIIGHYRHQESDSTISPFPSKSPEKSHPELNNLLASSLDNTQKFIRESIDSKQCGVNVQGAENNVSRNSTGATFFCQEGNITNIIVIFPWQLDKHGRKIQFTAKII
jgi:hypothetical protein